MHIAEAITKEQIEDAFSVRDQVFIKEQGVSPDIEHDEHDKDAIHIIGYIDEVPIAAARVRIVDQIGKVERVSVIKSYRNKGYGKQMMKAIELILIRHDLKKVRLNAQTRALDFYQTLHYIQTSEPFYEANIEHVSMEKTL
ncbi:hypothetical protein SAMN05421734_10664 [Pelagirhabdus alkalitolerans]|uniref:N-acetyltransferase domain-containing protein n=1 Tax=Pelagirhabdus alkalitolerans TaxID=1612202 RepID=A0A1G6KGH2_9BACI|nr:GNAT family N-acetyltransferase [Pelagirhabdus alkalitolerans]SDC29406.1 hypothetical protein SAMN05421734_10664 [Pelagirhabdus alkalitolerans]